MTHAGLSRREVLLAAVATALAPPAAARAAPADPVARLLASWARTPAAHPLLGDWRRVGYRRGAAEPRPPAGRRVRIAPDGERDMSGRLQRALDDLGARGGGMLELAPGRYVLDRPLFVHRSHIVLRGAGSARTTLHFTRPLRESLDAGGTRWSWTGGQVFFLSRDRLRRSMEVDWDQRSEGWQPGRTLAIVAPAARGARVLHVSGTADVTPGEMVVLEVDNLEDQRLLREMAGDVDGAGIYDWRQAARQIAYPSAHRDLVRWRWPVVVDDVLARNAVRLEQPLRLALRHETPARLRVLGPTVHDSGVEGVTIENALVAQTPHNLHPGSNGVCFQAVHDCWARDVHVLHADVAFALTAAKSCTLSGISAGGRALHHFVVCRVGSHDNLVEDFTLEDPWIRLAPGAVLHGINVEGLSSGNVYRRGVLRVGTFDSHRQMPFENLRTAIRLRNRLGAVGGGADAGPYFGARTAHWGIEVTGGSNLAMDIADAAPRSVSAGVAGLARPGSGGLGDVAGGGTFAGDLRARRIAFGEVLGAAADLLDVQRRLIG